MCEQAWVGVFGTLLGLLVVIISLLVMQIASGGGGALMAAAVMSLSGLFFVWLGVVFLVLQVMGVKGVRGG
ncbi:hypothetical protein [Poriferisphaera corsica]|uniref:hypothetical protein n=1 Tax=Poriferisphaera corsica TaxID=2528020 RepID=UPI0011A5406B|nr:hypothetical protein [Poriferisphaera corsica]